LKKIKKRYLTALLLVFLVGTYWALDRAMAIASLSTVEAKDPAYEKIRLTANIWIVIFFSGLIASVIVIWGIVYRVNIDNNEFDK
jgi:hypothetical protein